MPKLMIRLAKSCFASYEITTDTNDVAVAEKLEKEKLRSYDYEKSLDLEWNFDEDWAPDIIEIDLPSDEAD
jgi:hypothetical protein